MKIINIILQYKFCVLKKKKIVGIIIKTGSLIVKYLKTMACFMCEIKKVLLA